MLARTDLRGSTPTLAQLRRALPRGGTDVNAVLDTVEPVVHAVAQRGAEARQRVVQPPQGRPAQFPHALDALVDVHGDDVGNQLGLDDVTHATHSRTSEGGRPLAVPLRLGAQRSCL